MEQICCIALVRALTAERRVVSRTRIASTAPSLVLGVGRRSGVRAVRAAVMASSGSDLPRRRRSARLGRMTLDHGVPGPSQVSGQAGAVGVGALDAEAHHVPEGAHERDQRRVAGPAGGELLVTQDSASGGVDNGDVVGVGVGVNSGDDFGRRGFDCHDGGAFPSIGQARTGRAGRQDVDGTWFGQAPMRSCPHGRRTLIAPRRPGDRSQQRQLFERQS